MFYYNINDGKISLKMWKIWYNKWNKMKEGEAMNQKIIEFYQKGLTNNQKKKKN